MICLACNDPAERTYAITFERRDGERRDVTAALCPVCADDLLARDWITRRTPRATED